MRKNDRGPDNLFMGKHYAGIIPGIPTPEQKEIPDTELLVTHPPYLMDERPLPIKPREHVLIPNYGTLYGTNKVKDSWADTIDNFAQGTAVTVAGSTVVVPVNLTSAPNWSLSQWPGAICMFLALRGFSAAPQALPVTAGNVTITYQDALSGDIVPIAVVLTNRDNNMFLDSLLPNPISDPNNQAVGNLSFTLSAGSSAVTLNWQLSFSAAYLIPQVNAYQTTEKGYSIHHDGYNSKYRR